MKKLALFLIFISHFAFANEPLNSNKMLYLGLVENNLAYVETAISRGANFNHLYDNDLSPLMLACDHNDNPQIIKKLINSGADINFTNSKGDNTLSIALKKRASAEIIELLLYHGANPNHPLNFEGNPIYPLTLAVMLPSSLDIINLLLATSNQDAKFQALMATVTSENQAIYDLFITAGVVKK